MRAELTAREFEVLTRMAHGATYDQVGREFHLSGAWASVIGHRVIRKLGAHSIAHAVLLACQAGILDGRPRRHGDHAGHAAHIYRGEEPCEACIEGEKAYKAAWRAKRKTRQREAA